MLCCRQRAANAGHRQYPTNNDVTGIRDLTLAVDLKQFHGAGPFRARFSNYVALLPA
jgi:hypothetical protein